MKAGGEKVKKTIAFLLCAVTLVLLAACGAGKTASIDPTDTPITEAPEMTAAPSAEPTPAPTSELTPEPTAEPSPTPKPESVEDVIIAMINDSVEYQFFYEPTDLTRYTIESVPVYKHKELEEALAGYPAFRAANDDILFYDDENLDAGGLDALLDNLYLHRAEVIFYSAVGEIYETGYSVLHLDFDFRNKSEDGKYAMAVVLVMNTFRYDDIDYDELGMEDSLEGIFYLISFVRFEDEWRIIAIESDSLFYEEYREKGFDLERHINGVKEAHDSDPG